MTPPRTTRLAAVAVLVALAACGGGAGPSAAPSGTLQLALTDSPACGYDHAFVTVDKVRVHQSPTAGDDDAGWQDVQLPAPTRVDLLGLDNGTLLPLGQTELPAGTYTQLRLVLADNSADAPLANALQPTGGPLVPLTTPSGQHSGLKLNVNLTVPPGQVADFAIDFDACKSFVRAGNSGRYLLKPVLAVIPIVSAAGQRIVGFVDPALAVGTTTASAQVGGVPVRATPPDASGRFTLYPVPAGTYDVVVVAPGRVNVAITGVPVSSDQTTVIGSTAVRIVPPASARASVASGTVSVNGSLADTHGAVRALQTFADSTRIETGYAAADSDSGAYAITLPLDAPLKQAYVPQASAFAFAADGTAAGRYSLEASAPGFTPKTTAVIDFNGGDVATDFAFP